MKAFINLSPSFARYDLDSENSIEGIRKQLEQTVKQLDDLKELLYSNMTDEQFCKKAVNLYNCQIDESDVLYIISQLFDGTTCTKHIETSLISKNARSSGFGKNFSYWTEYSPLCLKISCLNEELIDNKHVYTYTELKELIDTRKILIIEKILCPPVSPLTKEQEKDTGRDSSIEIVNHLSIYNILNNKDSIFYPVIISVIKNNLTKERIKRDIDVLMQNTLEATLDLSDKTLKKYIDSSNQANMCKELIDECDRVKQKKLSINL